MVLCPDADSEDFWFPEATWTRLRQPDLLPLSPPSMGVGDRRSPGYRPDVTELRTNRCSCLSECLLNPCLNACEPCFHHNLEPGLSHLPLLPDRREEPCRPHLTAPLLCLACLPTRHLRKRLWGRRTPALEPRSLFSVVWGSGGVGTTRRWGLGAHYT